MSGPYTLQGRWRVPVAEQPGPDVETWSEWEDRRLASDFVEGPTLTFPSADAARAWMTREGRRVRERMWRRRAVQVEFRAVGADGEEILGQEPTPLPEPCGDCGRLHPPVSARRHLLHTARPAIVLLVIGVPLVLLTGAGPRTVFSVVAALAVVLAALRVVNWAMIRGGWLGYVTLTGYTVGPIVFTGLLTWSFLTTGDILPASITALFAGLLTSNAFAEWRIARRFWRTRRLAREVQDR